MDSSSNPAGSEMPKDRCPRCNSGSLLVRTMLDPRNGKSVRMFECKCGARTWDDLFSAAV
jgi:hypothetical protein